MRGDTNADRRGSEPGARILLVEAATGRGSAERSELAAALAPLATGSLECVADLGGCIDRLIRGRVDLVVVDEALGREAEEIVARLRRRGFALVVLQRGASDAAALAWFRRGAADCVSADRDFSALRHAAREQLERVHAIRASAPDLAFSASGADGILRNLGSALVVVDARGCITFANPAAEQILGTPQERLRGQEFGDRLADETGKLALFAALERGEGRRAIETRARRSDGHVVPIGLSWGPIVTADGTPSGAVAVFQDLSDAQQWRAHVLQTEKMASIGQLAAGVAHEINNPMGFIHANLFQMADYVSDLRQVWTRVEALQKAVGKRSSARSEAEPSEDRTGSRDRSLLERASDELGEAAEELDVSFVLQDLAKAIRESQEGSERIRHIVQDLRDFSHQDTGERVLADINQCLDSTANIVWPMMKHLVVLDKHYAALPPVPCYPMQLKQVFMNLLVNAYQAIEETVGSSGEIGTVTLTTAPHEGGVQVEVRDSGVGIAPEHLDRIFDPFFTTKKVGAGTGLGLSTSFNIVRRHGGTLGVESSPGRGTSFKISLPLLREDIGSDPE